MDPADSMEDRLGNTRPPAAPALVRAAIVASQRTGPSRFLPLRSSFTRTLLQLNDGYGKLQGDGLGSNLGRLFIQLRLANKCRRRPRAEQRLLLAVMAHVGSEQAM